MSLSNNNENEYWGNDMALESEPHPKPQEEKRTDTTKEQIYQLQKKIYELDQKTQKKKTKRNIMMTLLHSLLFFFLITAFNKGASLEFYLGIVVVSVVFGGITFGVNSTVFFWFIHENERENRYLESMQKELSELYKRLDK